VPRGRGAARRVVCQAVLRQPVVRWVVVRQAVVCCEVMCQAEVRYAVAQAVPFSVKPDGFTNVPL
jgi:hypothetical protein